jgi:hypothetical protein
MRKTTHILTIEHVDVSAKIMQCFGWNDDSIHTCIALHTILYLVQWIVRKPAQC